MDKPDLVDLTPLREVIDEAFPGLRGDRPVMDVAIDLIADHALDLADLGHLVSVDADRWNLRHPIECRKTVEPDECGYTRAMQALGQGADVEAHLPVQGVYQMTLDDDGPHFVPTH